jgi:hypothetical protein
VTSQARANPETAKAQRKEGGEEKNKPQAPNAGCFLLSAVRNANRKGAKSDSPGIDRRPLRFLCAFAVSAFLLQFILRYFSSLSSLLGAFPG